MSDKLAVIQAQESIEELKRIEDAIKSVISTTKDLIKNANQINKALKTGTPREYTRAINEMNTATRDFNKSQMQMASQLTRISKLERQVSQMLREQSKSIREVANATREENRAKEAAERIATQQQRTAREAANAKAAESRANRDASNALNAESRARQQAVKEANANAKANAENAESYKRFSRDVLDAKNKAKNLGAEMILLEQDYKRGAISTKEYNTQMNKLSREFVEAKTKAIGLHSQIRKLDASVGDNQRNVGNYKSAINGIATSFRNLIGAFGVVGAVDMFANLVQSSFKTIKVLNAQNTALNEIFETQAQVAYQQEFLAGITNRYGLEIVSTTASYSKYSASVKDTALEGEKARKIFESFTAASAKLGLNAETQSGIFKALEQMISKGTVQAEELRGQLGDRMPGAFKLFADAAGVSTSKLGNMMKNGEVLASDILPKVAEKLDETYSKSEKVDTVVAAQNRLTNAWTSFLNEVSGNKEILNGLATGMEGLGDVMNFLLDTLIVKGTDGVSVVGDLIEIIESLYGAVTGMAEGLGLMDEKTKNSLFSMNQFKNDLKSIQAVVSVITGTIKGLTETISAFFETMFQENGWDKFMKKFETADNKLKDLYSNYNKTQDGIIAANKKGILYNNDADPYIEAWKKAREAKQAYFQLNGKYFDTKTGRNTGKSLDDYIDVGSTLKKKEKASPFNETEPKKLKTNLSKTIQKDYLKDLQANRDLELALNETKFVNAEISEKEYLQNILKINTDFFNKKIAYLKGNNAEERKQIAEANLEREKLKKDTQKKIFEYDLKELEEQNKIKINEFERASKQIDENQHITNVERLNQQIENDNKIIAQLSSSYDKRIALAKEKNQELDILELERKRDEEIGNIQDERLKRVNELPAAFNDDVDRISTLSENLQNKDYEEQRLKILQAKIPLRNKEFILNQLDLEANRVSLLNQRNDLELKKYKLEPLKEANKLTKDQEVQYSEILARISNINSELDVTAKNLEQLRLTYLLEDLQPLKELLGNGLNDLGLNNISKQFDDLFDKIATGAFTAKDAVVLAASAIADGLTAINNKSKENTIASLDEQLKYTQSATEQELDFINQRLNRLNALEELNQEQIDQRNQLEDEARAIKEQQAQREKLIEAQKARAEQKAAAQQALINGALAATMTLAQMGFIAGAIPAGLALAFGIGQSIAIMSKEPVPKYFVGRKGGRAEFAITQDGGRELITDKKGNIKSLGSDKGDQLTWLAEGDNVHTAKETKDIFRRMATMPKIGENIYQKIALQSLKAPAPVVINKNVDNSQTIIDGIGQKFENALKKYDKPVVIKNGGKIILYRGANLGLQIGEYDQNGNETYYS